MKKIYVTPDAEVVRIEMTCILAGSNGDDDSAGGLTETINSGSYGSDEGPTKSSDGYMIGD